MLIAGQGRPLAMLSVASTLLSRLVFSETITRRDAATLVIVATLHLAALVIMTATELDVSTKITFLLAWGLLNCLWLAVLRRPAIAALLSLTIVVLLILFSLFKYDKLMMTINFVDLMIIDPDTVTFLFKIMPRLRWPQRRARSRKRTLPSPFTSWCPSRRAAHPTSRRARSADRSVPTAPARLLAGRHSLLKRADRDDGGLSGRFLWRIL